MVVGNIREEFEVAVIGGGPGGYVAAIKLAQIKKDVVLIEKNLPLGGICLKEGCIPSKALIYGADILDKAKNSTNLGIKIENIRLQMEKLIEWKDNIVKNLSNGIDFLMKKWNIPVFEGKAKFIDKNLLSIEGKEYKEIKFENAIISTGSSPLQLKDFSFDGEKILNSSDLLSLKEIPEKMAIIGAGFTGLEFSALYAKLGSKIYLIEKERKILKDLDEDAVSILLNRLKALGVEIYLGYTPLNYDGKLLKISNEEETKFLEVDKIAVLVGRVPNTKSVGLEEIGVALDEKDFIKVNDKLQTSIPNIYAIGDVIGPPFLAHKASRQAKISAEVIGNYASAFDNYVIPACIYTDPEIAWAGILESQAKEKGIDILTGKFNFKASGRAWTLNYPYGFIKIIAEKETKRIIGALIVGENTSELISEATLAIEMVTFLDDLEKIIHPHPTLSESFVESVENSLGRVTHI